MAATLGNKFWQLRDEHGRKKLFETPEALLKEATDYFKWCDDNPIMKSDVVKSGEYAGQVLNIPIARPFTLMGLCLYMGVSTEYLTRFEKRLQDEKDEELKKGFLRVITHIRETIRNQKFEGAAAGIYNHNIIARDLGLVDKKEETGALSVQVSRNVIQSDKNAES